MAKASKKKAVVKVQDDYTPPNLFRCPSDETELEFKRSYTVDNLKMYEYIYTKAKVKSGQKLVLLRSDIEYKLRKGIFIDISHNTTTNASPLPQLQTLF